MQQNRIYVGNLNYNAKPEEIKALFEKYGSVQSVNIILDRQSGQSRGFAFVEMSSPEEAHKTLELNGTDFMGRHLTVSEARPQEPRSPEQRSASRRLPGRSNFQDFPQQKAE